jgi:cysteine desulfurase family protein (TIGR01976 family)
VTATAEPELDVDRLRQSFPALTRQVGGATAIYLDGPGGSQTPTAVVDAAADYLYNHNANVDGEYVTSIETDRLLDDARVVAADFLGASPEEIIFGASTTTTNFLLAHALGRTFEPGDEIVVTELDHDANVSPWLLVGADHGLTVRTAPLNRVDGTLDFDALQALISSRTRVVACTLASNALGTVPDIARVEQAAHNAGALLWLDGVHFAPHRRLSRAALGADVLLTSAYKYFGPHLGVAAIRRGLAESLPADRVRPADQSPAGHRFETGTLSHEGVAGFVAAVDYLESLGEGPDRGARLDSAFRRIAAHETALTQYTLQRMAEISGCTLYGIADPDRVDERTPTLCFNLAGWEPRALNAALGERGIFTSHGNYYALGVMLALELEAVGGAVRAGYLHYTSEDEVERFCSTVAALA